MKLFYGDLLYKKNICIQIYYNFFYEKSMFNAGFIH